MMMKMIILLIKFILSMTSVIFLPYTLAVTTIDIRNNCPFVLWPAVIPGGGRLDPGEKWVISVDPDKTSTNGSRVWARTNCKFDASGNGRCQTGDCNGLLRCKQYGRAPATLVEFALGQIGGTDDFFDLSLVEGFNVPMEFRPVSSVGECTRRSVACTDDLNGKCPDKLRAPGGCHNPCGVSGMEEFCCQSPSNCSYTIYSRFFKDRCPDAFSYFFDGPRATCPGGTNYTIIFCP